jgi:branched-chain amino acid transport system ATP-binding protein
MSELLLEARSVDVSYGKAAAVRDVSLTLREGEIVTIVGPNGAGKTTLLNALMGLQPSHGVITWFGGKASASAGAERLVRVGIGLIPERRELFGPMSVDDNLSLGAFSRRGAPDIEETRNEVFALFPRLRERRLQRASTLSGGERQMLATGRALMGRPRVLMLDEPSLGLAPTIVQDIFRMIGALRDKGVSILLVEQNARSAMAVADRAYVMESGSFTLEGRAAELRQDPRIIDTYLGV